MKTILTLLCLLGALSASAETNRVRILWNPNTETNLAGYVVTYGTNAGFSTNALPLWSSGLITSTSILISNLSIGPTYSFAVRAVDTNGMDSEPSEEVQWNFSRPARPVGVRRVSVTVTLEGF